MAHLVQKRIELNNSGLFNDVCSAAWDAGAFVRPDMNNVGIIEIMCYDDLLTAVNEAIAVANPKPSAEVASPVDGPTT